MKTNKQSFMDLVQVTDSATEKQFIEAHVVINKPFPNWIRPLDKDIREVFDPRRNKAFRFGEAARWILQDSDGNLLGRIAAFANKKYKNKGDDVPVGGIGFFDCINQQEAADRLFDVAKHWLLQKGYEAIDGPINFGERDRWWGLLVEGTQPPLYCMNFNPPYYQCLFEQYGFRPFYDQICFSTNPKQIFQQKLRNRHAAIAADPDFSADYIRHNDLGKVAEDFATVYNKAWGGHGGLKQVSKESMLKSFRTMKPVMDKKIIWFATYKGEPIAMWLNLPDLNQWFRFLNGNFNLLSKLKFLWIKATRPCRKYVGLVFGVVPEFQSKGVDSYLIIEASNFTREHLPYDDYEMQWIGDFNPKMIGVAETLGTHRSRRLTTYRYLFDRTKEFKRHPTV